MTGDGRPDAGAPPPAPAPLPEPWPFVTAAWGVAGAMVGVVVLVLAWIVLQGILVIVANAVGLPLDSLAVRYAVLLGAQGLLVGMAAGAAWLFRAGRAGLGLHRLPLRGIWEGLIGGVLLAGAVHLYSEVLLRSLSPALYERMVEEVLEQMTSLEAPWPVLLISAVIIAPIGEELFFRGFVFGGLRSQLRFWPAAIASSTLFAMVHLMPLSFVPLFAVGLVAAWLYERQRSLIGPLVVHAAFNGSVLTIGLFVGP